MNNNQLDFKLGLATEGFLAPLKESTSKVREFSSEVLRLPGLGLALGGLIGSFASLDKILENVFAQFEKGAGLAAAARQISTSAEEIFLVQKGFAGVGLSADMATPAIFQMQKALGGVNELGEDTKSIFHAMGLNIENLKALSTPAQLKEIFEGLDKLNPESAAKASSSIFGRGLGREMLQAAHGVEEYGEAMRRAAPAAEIMGRNAAGFEKVEHALARIKSTGSGFFLGIAEGAAPEILRLADSINSINLTGLGETLGGLLAAFGEAFRQNRFGELFALGMKAAIQEVNHYLGRTLLSNPAVESILMAARIGFYASPLSEPFLDSTYATVLKRAKPAGAPDDWVNPDLVAFKEAAKAFSDAGYKLTHLGERYRGGGIDLDVGLDKSKAGVIFPPQVNDLERLGLVRLGGGLDNDYAARTARAAERAIAVQERIAKAVENYNFDYGDRDYNNR